MSQLIIVVTEMSVPSPYDQVALMGTVQLEDTGPSGGYPWSAYASAGGTQEDVRLAVVAAAEAVATGHSWTSTGAIVVSWPEEVAPTEPFDDSDLCVVPAAGSPVTLALSTPRRPSTARPTRVTVYGQISLTSTLLGPQTATATLKSDSSATPSTAVGVATAALSGVVATSAPPYTLTYDVPTGHYYQVVASGGGSAGVSISHINEQVM